MSHFVWTRMNAEAGQTLHTILHRKEAERRAGDGIFWWGVGHSLGQHLPEIARRAGGSLPVLFSLMLSTPNKADARPEQTWLWTAWEDWDGHEHEVPKHIVCLHRSNNRRYALVCRSDISIGLGDHGAFDPHCLARPPGPQQVTVLLEGKLPQNGDHHPGRYHWGFKAELIKPWIVKLARARLLEDDERNSINGKFGFDNWLQLTKQLRSK
jgi:hypothetical protein